MAFLTSGNDGRTPYAFLHKRLGMEEKQAHGVQSQENSIPVLRLPGNIWGAF